MRGIDVTTYRPADHQPEPEGPVVTDPDPDYEDWTDEDVAAEYAKVAAEHKRRQRMAQAERTAEAATIEWVAAAGRKDGDKWAQPTGVHNAYPEGAEVTHPVPGTSETGLWVSTVDHNTWEPGVAGWRLQPADDDRPALWVRPSSTIDAYEYGELVTYPDYETGDVYRSVWSNPNTWSPSEFPDAWELVEHVPTAPTPGEPEEPEPEPDPGDGDDDAPVWVRPVWAGEEGGAYPLGALVRYPDEDGPVYVSTHDGWNTWAPGEYGWSPA